MHRVFTQGSVLTRSIPKVTKIQHVTGDNHPGYRPVAFVAWIAVEKDVLGQLLVLDQLPMVRTVEARMAKSPVLVMADRCQLGRTRFSTIASTLSGEPIPSQPGRGPSGGDR